MKKITLVSILLIVAIASSGCSVVGLTLSDDVDKELNSGKWERINSDKVQREVL